jgi:hypothetical protein
MGIISKTVFTRPRVWKAGASGAIAVTSEIRHGRRVNVKTTNP